MEDEFDVDYDLDNLSVDVLGDIEQLAWLSTQRSAAPTIVVPDPPGVVQHLEHSYAEQKHDVADSRLTEANPGQYRLSSSDYGFDDEDVIDLGTLQLLPDHAHVKTIAKPFAEVIQREGWHHQRHGAPAQQVQERLQPVQQTSYEPFVSTKHAWQAYSPAQPKQDMDDATLVEQEGAHTTDSVDELSILRARIQELEQERTLLQKTTEDAKSMALSKSGETAIVRANHDKAIREYDRRLAVFQHLHAEEMAKQTAELNAAKKECEKVETNNRFLEHDLAQEAQRAKLKKPLKDGDGNINRISRTNEGNVLRTPQKSKSYHFRDGFEDDEVLRMSPSKMKEQLGQKAGSKRKRLPTERSPSKPLPLSQPELQSQTDGLGQFGPSTAELPLRPKSVGQDEKFEFLNLVLNHQPHFGSDRTIETLTRYALPSEPNRSFASMIYDSLSHLPPENDLEHLRSSACENLMLLWRKTLDEKHHIPLYHLIELLRYILVISPARLSVLLIPTVVPLCSTTIDLVTIPIAAKSKQNPSVNPTQLEILSQVIEPLDYLDILHLIVLNCGVRNDDLILFWKAIEFEFVLVMLNKGQPLARIEEMLQLLATSVLPNTFGAILPVSDIAGISTTSVSQQSKVEAMLVDRLSCLLFDPVEAPSDEIPYSATEVLQLRYSVIDLLRALCQTHHGGYILATHRMAIARLVRFIHEQVVAMYEYRRETHDLTTELVNRSVMVLAHLTSVHGDVVDMRSKLAAMPGAAHRHLVALSRVAFGVYGYELMGSSQDDEIRKSRLRSESVLEKGILPEVAEQAHRMLDKHLSPEEGDMVVEVFASV